MSNIDQFESIFRAAAKVPYVHKSVHLTSVLVVTDLDPAAAEEFGADIRTFLDVLESDDFRWRVVSDEEYRNTKDLLELVEGSDADLICTYRNLKSKAWEFPFSLGEYLDVLTQKSKIPVLVVPHPAASYASDRALEDTMQVMALTDHLAADHDLVNYAVHFTQSKGTLFLVHVEDKAAFDRYIDAISKIPSINTEDARTRLEKQLLKEPRDYIVSCRKALEAAGRSVTVKELVTFGHHLSEYRLAIAANAIDLLVMNTKDDDQLAMHGLAYPLAVEIRQIPILML